MTYTVATMKLSQRAYGEILAKLRAAGYGHAIGEDGMLDMTHIGILPDEQGNPNIDGEMFVGAGIKVGGELEQALKDQGIAPAVVATPQLPTGLHAPGSIVVLFDGPPGPTAGRFVEVEDHAGRPIRVGNWHQRPGTSYWELVIAPDFKASQ